MCPFWVIISFFFFKKKRNDSQRDVWHLSWGSEILCPCDGRAQVARLHHQFDHWHLSGIHGSLLSRRLVLVTRLGHHLGQNIW